MPKLLDIGLYLGSAFLIAAGLTWIKIELSQFAGVGLAAITLGIMLQLALAAVVYVGGMGLWLLALGRNPLSVAYPIGIGLSLASATLAASLVLGEPVGGLRLLGIIAILAGAACIGRSHY